MGAPRRFSTQALTAIARELSESSRDASLPPPPPIFNTNEAIKHATGLLAIYSGYRRCSAGVGYLWISCYRGKGRRFLSGEPTIRRHSLCPQEAGQVLTPRQHGTRMPRPPMRSLTRVCSVRLRLLRCGVGRDVPLHRKIYGSARTGRPMCIMCTDNAGGHGQAGGGGHDRHYAGRGRRSRSSHAGRALQGFQEAGRPARRGRVAARRRPQGSGGRDSSNDGPAAAAACGRGLPVQVVSAREGCARVRLGTAWSIPRVITVTVPLVYVCLCPLIIPTPPGRPCRTGRAARRAPCES